MNRAPCQCLILACGNTLRGDDGVGPWLAQWAAERFGAEPGIRCVARHQWTPDLAEEIAQAQSVIFIDCSANSAPGQLQLSPVKPSAELPRMLTHHLTASDLVTLCCNYYDSRPQNAVLVTVGGGAFDLHEGFSAPVQAALPDAKGVLEGTVLRLLAASGVSANTRRA
jgi:hydrogenase maturation protease